MDDGGNIFAENSSLSGTNNQHGLHASFDSDIRQEHILRNDKLLIIRYLHFQGHRPMTPRRV